MNSFCVTCQKNTEYLLHHLMSEEHKRKTIDYNKCLKHIHLHTHTHSKLEVKQKQNNAV